jgi:hypothetical protein
MSAIAFQRTHSENLCSPNWNKTFHSRILSMWDWTGTVMIQGEICMNTSIYYTFVLLRQVKTLVWVWLFWVAGAHVGRFRSLETM